MVNVEHQYLLSLIVTQKTDVFIIFVLMCNKNIIFCLENYNKQDLGAAVFLIIHLTLSAYIIHVEIHN